LPKPGQCSIVRVLEWTPNRGREKQMKCDSCGAEDLGNGRWIYHALLRCHRCANKQLEDELDGIKTVRVDPDKK